jgi:hypothetical protein
VSGSITGSYCTPGSPEVCVPPASMRIDDLGGSDAQACASVDGLGEVCAHL